MEYNCKICNKKFKTYQTLWKHNKSKHIIQSEIKNENNLVQLQSSDLSEIKCKFCDRPFNFRNNKWKHEKVCKEKQIIDLNQQTKNNELILQIKKEEANILRLQLELQKSTKNDNMTIKKINKLLENKSTNIHHHHYVSNFGKEDVVETLTKQEKRMIMNAKYSSLEKLIEIVHCGKYNQFKNIIITNMKDNYMYKYDDKLGHFVLSTKLDVLNSLINYRLDDLEVIYNDLLEKNKLDDKTKDCIEKFINKINYDDNKYIDYDGKQHKNYKEYKINEIKVLLFNNHDKITKDISLLLTTDEFITNKIEKKDINI